MKFVITLSSILAIFAFAVQAHSQMRTGNMYECTSKVSFVATSTEVSDETMKAVIADFMAHSTNATRSQNDQVTQTVVLLQSTRAASDILKDEVQKTISKMNQQHSNSVKIFNQFEKCGFIAGAGLM